MLYFFKPFLLVLIIFPRMRLISYAFFFKFSSNGYVFDLSHNSSQYFVSSNSFAAILSLCIKSALLSAFCASRIFAPILVPDLSSCFEITYFLLCSRSSQKSMILSAKKVDFSTIILLLPCIYLNVCPLIHLLRTVRCSILFS